MHLEKKRTYACTFLVQRKEINVVKVRFTMRYSSRKLSHEKLLKLATFETNCLFFPGNLLLLGNKIFEIPPVFQTRPGLITFSRPEIPTLVAQISISFAVLAIILETPDFGAYLPGSRLAV